MTYERTSTDTRSSPKGPGALTRPADGWTDKGLGRVFGDPDAAENHLSGGAIAGIVVGAVAALILLAVGSWYLWKRLRTDSQATQHGDAAQTAEWQAPDRDES